MTTKVSVRTDGSTDAENAYIVVTDDDIFGRKTWHVHTNREGDGLWINGKQSLGTAQFTLRGVKDKAAKIRRYFVDYYRHV